MGATIAKRAPGSTRPRAIPVAIPAAIPGGEIATSCGDLPEASFYIVRMRYLTLWLLVAAALTACGDVAIGPVDLSCRVNPMRGSGPSGSGCDTRG
jgi:hypothetical protein